ncbi:hypothetical protein [Candidatus Erwinia haradaeae]|uniref:hypothetical protein n=1 Tax=Candidatus Erwinia haradaeae TaxID=1922217 RepID=UPI001300532D|nr:hypothetical protein [Candidatus Erwinia haradaeae]
MNYTNNDSHIVADLVTWRTIQNHIVSVSIIANTASEADCWDSDWLIIDMERAQILV